MRNEASQALPIIASRMTAVAAMTIRKTASSLKKMRFFTGLTFQRTSYSNPREPCPQGLKPEALQRLIAALKGCSSTNSFWDLEAVAGAADGFQVTGIFRVGLDFFANAANVDIDRARSYEGGVAPDGVEKVITREDASLVTGKVVEQAELGGGGGDHAAADREGHGRGVDFDVANFHGARWKRAFEAAQDSVDAGDKLAGAEGLRNIVIGAEFEPEDAVRLAAFRGEENYRHGGEPGGLTDGAAEVEAVFAGNHDLQNQERVALPVGVGAKGAAGWVDAHGEAFIFQVMADQAGNVGIVFNDEDAGLHGSILSEVV